MDRCQKTHHFYCFLRQRRTVLQQRLLKRARFLRFRQLRFQVFAEVLLILPRMVAKRALGSIDEIKTFLDK